MSVSTSDEIIAGYIEEVKTYIPSLKKGISDLVKDSSQKAVLEEVHRLVHTIKGASSMVGIYGLSHIAYQMEDALDEIIAGRLVFDQKAAELMSQTISHFEAWCENYIGKGVNARDRLRETVLGYRRLRNLPEAEDKKVLANLMDTVPEIEGTVVAVAEPEEAFTEEIEESQEDEDLLTDEEAELMALLESEEKMFEEPSEAFSEAVDETISEPSIPEEAPTPAPSEPIPELLESFYEEAEEHLEVLGRSLNAIDAQVTQAMEITDAQRELIRQIRRAVHTLKGASAVIGLPNISAFAHSFEDLLDWIYEDATTIDPGMVAVLMDSADLLEVIVGNPKDPQTAKVDALQVKYREILGQMEPQKGQPSQPKPKTAQPQVPSVAEPEQTEQIPQAPQAEEEMEPGAEELPGAVPGELPEDMAGPGPQVRTLRVAQDRIDELVNLTGELIIASSAFDQKMDQFLEGVQELEISRARFREIARDMEVGYEVKALEGMHRTAGSQSRFQPQSSQVESGQFDDFDSMELDRYSELSLIIRTLNESVIDVGAINNQLTNLYSDFDGILTRQRVLLSELQDKMMRVRMTPMATITNKLRRTVREVGKRLGKKLRLIIEGSDIELDRVIWEKITDPLMHLLRNAADHGIEPPELRQALKKPPVATIKLSAMREGNNVVIRVSDDGAGLNYPAIRETALKAGLASNVDQMSEEELAQFIFHPGFSTRSQITEVSGRGVGMDVVKENIHDLKGTIRVRSWKGKGTQFSIRIPLTLAAIRALLFMVGGQMFAVALNEISEIIRISPDQISGQINEVVRIGNDVLPLYYLVKILRTSKTQQAPDSMDENPIILVGDVGGQRGAMVVDSLVGQREIVIKSLGSHLRYVRGISGATIMGDGSVVPILNLEEVFSEHGAVVEMPEHEAAPISEKPLEIMVVDDSVSIRQVVSRLVEDQGWKAHTAKDGIDALERLREIRPDLIILDIEMPRMNGYEFLSAIKNQTAYQDIPVVMLTSRATAKHRDKAISLGARGLVVKPYNDDEFINLILKLTEKDR